MQRPLPQLRSARFWTAASASTALVCISILFVWSATDASFRIALWKAEFCLHLPVLPSENLRVAEVLGIADAMRALRWGPLDQRVVVLYALCAVGIASTVTVFILTIRSFTAKRLFACTSVLAAWGVLVATRTTVDDWRARRQVSAILPRFEQAAVALSQRWPTKSGEVHPGIRFYVWPEKYPNVLKLRGSANRYPYHEDFGLMITRGQKGIIRFDLAGSADCCVEYHPSSTSPSAYTSGFGYPSPPVASAAELKDKWYLVRYAAP
jgi:hypothetical protein